MADVEESRTDAPIGSENDVSTGPKDVSIGGLWASTVAAGCYVIPFVGPLVFYVEDNRHVRHHAVHGLLFWTVAPVVAYGSHVTGMAVARSIQVPGHWLWDPLIAIAVLSLIGGVPLVVGVVAVLLVYKARVGDLYALPGLGRIVRWAV